jgi:DNA-binding transcriptional ArsR family regulator
MTEQRPTPDRGFEVLSDETRLGILRALSDRLREAPESPGLGFSDLRRRVGVRDSGNFNYHLEKLRGRFVTKADGGYRLAPAGLQVVAALITGVYGDGAELGPTELDDACPVCEERLTATYEDDLLQFTCPNDHSFGNALVPGVVENRSLAEVIEIWTLKTRQDLELAVENVCPFCYAHVELSPEFDRMDGLPEVETRCHRCGVRLEIPVIVAVVYHPTAAAFYGDHGIDVRRRPLWAPEFYGPVGVTPAPERRQFDVTVELDGETLEATLDDSLSVLDVTR